jgi:hypothetical protein
MRRAGRRAHGLFATDGCRNRRKELGLEARTASGRRIVLVKLTELSKTYFVATGGQPSATILASFGTDS